MQHDIYSLGVVLLEIGLWTSFVTYAKNLDLEDEIPDPDPLLITESANEKHNPLGNASDIKGKLEALAKSELPSRLGRRYTDIVLSCLRCLDQSHEGDSTSDEKDRGFGINDVGAELTDEDGVVIGVRYIENVLEKMQEITI